MGVGGIGREFPETLELFVNELRALLEGSGERRRRCSGGAKTREKTTRSRGVIQGRDEVRERNVRGGSGGGGGGGGGGGRGSVSHYSDGEGETEFFCRCL